MSFGMPISAVSVELSGSAKGGLALAAMILTFAAAILFVVAVVRGLVKS